MMDESKRKWLKGKSSYRCTKSAELASGNRFVSSVRSYPYNQHIPGRRRWQLDWVQILGNDKGMQPGRRLTTLVLPCGIEVESFALNCQIRLNWRLSRHRRASEAILMPEVASKPL